MTMINETKTIETRPIAPPLDAPTKGGPFDAPILEEAED
jgi:hypothetical protein